MQTRTETVKATSRYSSFAVYAWSVLVWNVLVVLWGAFVRATGSGAGCGNHWPTCNGVVLPQSPSVHTLIEFTHRATSGIALLAVVVLIVWAWRVFPRGHAVRLNATLSGVFILTEALIGAGLVLFEHVAKNASVARGWSLSLHLINTFTLLAVLTLTASGGPAFPRILRFWPPLVSLILVGVSGAIAALGDTLFPVTSLGAALAQDFSPSAHLFVRLRVFHPFIAIIAVILVILSATRIKGEEVRNTKLALMILIAAQLCAGAMNLAMLAPVWMQLVHLLLADALWVAAILFYASAVFDDGDPLVTAPA